MITIPHRQVSILAGASGAGKTTLLLQCIESWARGTMFTEALQWEASRMAYIVADRTCSEVVSRVKMLGIPEDKLEVYGVQDDLTFKLEWLKDGDLALKEAIRRFKNPFDFLVIDPIALFLKASNLIDFKEVAIALMYLGRFAVERNITIFATHHAVKMKTDSAFKRPQDRISGSGALQGYSGSQMVLIEGKENGDPWDTLFVIPHLGPSREVHLRRDDRGMFCIWVGDNEKKGILAVKAAMELIPLGEIFDIRELSTLANIEGVAKTTFWRWIDNEVASGRIIKEGKAQYARTGGVI